MIYENEEPDEYNIFLNQKILDCYIDFALLIKLGLEENEIKIRIENEATFTYKNQVYKLLEYPNEISNDIITAIKESLITRIKIYKTGKLIICLEGEDCIVVMPDAKYEAWGVVFTNGLNFVCLPGGGIARFPPNSRVRNSGDNQRNPN